MAFYALICKRPIHVRREIKGHIANRLQAALWREAFHLVNEGVATVSDIDIDTAIAQGPGLRWALMGPFMNLHLLGGEGGIAHLLAHLGGPSRTGGATWGPRPWMRPCSTRWSMGWRRRWACGKPPSLPARAMRC